MAGITSKTTVRSATWIVTLLDGRKSAPFSWLKDAIDYKRHHGGGEIKLHWQS
jgi:hypothetical protein